MSAAEPTRRDFLFVATGAVGAVGAAATLIPLIAQMNPDASTIAAGAPLEVELSRLPDPQADQDRVKEGHDQGLVVIGICPHLGCIPLAHQGNYDGWFCPCHGSQYDTSGRIRQGPAPFNLALPPYKFVSDTTIRIGETAPAKA